jgi:hypothetical protein
MHHGGRGIQFLVGNFSPFQCKMGHQPLGKKVQSFPVTDGDPRCIKESIGKHMCSTMYIFVHGKYFV